MNYFTGEDVEILLQNTECNIFIPSIFTGDILKDLQTTSRSDVLQSEILDFYLFFSTTLKTEKEIENWKKVICTTSIAVLIDLNEKNLKNKNKKINFYDNKNKNKEEFKITTKRHLPRINSEATFLSNGQVVIPFQIEIITNHNQQIYNHKNYRKNNTHNKRDQIHFKIELITEKRTISELKFDDPLYKNNKKGKQREGQSHFQKITNFGFDPTLGVDDFFEKLTETPRLFKNIFTIAIPVATSLLFHSTYQLIGNINFLTVNLKNILQNQNIQINSIQLLLNSSIKIMNYLPNKDHKQLIKKTKGMDQNYRKYKSVIDSDFPFHKEFKKTINLDNRKTKSKQTEKNPNNNTKEYKKDDGKRRNGKEMEKVRKKKTDQEIYDQNKNVNTIKIKSLIPNEKKKKIAKAETKIKTKTQASSSK